MANMLGFSGPRIRAPLQDVGETPLLERPEELVATQLRRGDRGAGEPAQEPRDLSGLGQRLGVLASQVLELRHIEPGRQRRTRRGPGQPLRLARLAPAAVAAKPWTFFAEVAHQLMDLAPVMGE